MSYLNLNRPTDLIAHLKMLAVIIALSAPWDVNAADGMITLDTFEHQSDNSLGIPRQFFDDKMAGGKTHVNQTIAEGVFYAKGEIVPPRGQPGWASTVLLFNEQGLAKDLSQYDGIHLRIRVNAGNVSVSANSTEITNFDYHAAPIVVRADGEFHNVKIPFESLKRAWSAQTTLNRETINSISLVAFGMQPTKFDIAFDEIGFY